VSYLHDEDLLFLANCDDSDLNILIDVLIKDGDERYRLTQNLTEKESFKMNYPEHHKYWQLIAEELQYFGGNTIANRVRRHGVLYRIMLIEVCKKLKVNFNSKSSTETIEMNLMMKIMTDTIEKMSPEDLEEAAKSIKLIVPEFSKQAVVIALQAGIKLGGFASYKIAVIVANAVAKAVLGRGLTLAANAALTRAIGLFAGPIGITLTALWTAIDLAGPAYRVTIPAVIQIAYLRINAKPEIKKQLEEIWK